MLPTRGSQQCRCSDVLVEAGADIEARDYEEATPLGDAAYDVCPDSLAALVKHGARVNAQVQDYRTPLHDAPF